MAQSNVVREPSMDEILASIRRIIESNDTIPSAMPEPEGFAGSAANDDVEDVPLTIDEVFAPRAETVRAQAPDPQPFEASVPEASRPAEEPAQPRSLSLADVAARVRAASERNPALRDLAIRPSDAASAGTTASASSPLMTGKMAAAGGDRGVDAPAEPLETSAQPSSAGATSEDSRSGTPMAEPEAGVVQEPWMNGTPHVEAAPVALISEDTGQQVARSFQDLAVAVDRAERRSYDEIAAELLRPMLQEWLDENLPTLVERLVREEIERVARGNRR